MQENDNPLAESAEAEGKTVDEAIRKALIATGWKRDQITVDVLDHGGRSAWVNESVARVRLRRRSGDAFDLAQQVTTELLRRIGLPAQVKVEKRPDHLHVHVQGERLTEVLLSQDGEPLDALQHLVARIVSKQSATRQMVSVDLGGYRERRERDLRDMAYRLADEVRETGQQILTEPMGASERRVIHLALNEDPDITTFAIGDGLVKQIAIAPIDQAPPPEERRPGDRRGRGGRGGRDSGRGGRDSDRGGRDSDRGRGPGGDRHRRERRPGDHRHDRRDDRGRDDRGRGDRGGDRGRDDRPRDDRPRDDRPRDDRGGEDRGHGGYGPDRGRGPERGRHGRRRDSRG
jgi:spoIIIJ-associated protein